MRKRSWFARLLVGGLLAGGFLVMQSPPSQAGDCIYAEAYVTRENATPLWIWNGCVVPTDWNVTVEPEITDERPGVVPTGTPNGFYVYVRVPAP